MKHTGSAFRWQRSQIGSFKVGDTVRSLTNHKFPDGSTHRMGVKYQITEATVDWYNQRPTDYELVLSTTKGDL